MGLVDVWVYSGQGYERDIWVSDESLNVIPIAIGKGTGDGSVWCMALFMPGIQKRHLAFYWEFECYPIAIGKATDDGDGWCMGLFRPGIKRDYWVYDESLNVTPIAIGNATGDVTGWCTALFRSYCVYDWWWDRLNSWIYGFIQVNGSKVSFTFMMEIWLLPI